MRIATRLAPFLAALLLSQPNFAQSTTTPTTISCRALQTYSDSELKVVAVVFHQRDATQQEALAALLRDHSGETVEIRDQDGTWRKARLVRLAACFGRGLLLIAPPVPVAPHGEFQLRLANAPGGN